eukprot:TRINITY_DN195920_c0_g2_i1.p1 TRINITY_DN195920_c0_g2~~TRINITY_DN195920_c0_g2_i1.p1  ORF type:complete len:1934 (+),score=559.77 TRINITY_DN195920_c0_g2_i1:830-5803(+)
MTVEDLIDSAATSFKDVTGSHDLKPSSIDAYVLKVTGATDYLLNHSKSLVSFSHVNEAAVRGDPVELSLILKKDLLLSLKERFRSESLPATFEEGFAMLKSEAENDDDEEEADEGTGDALNESRRNVVNNPLFAALAQVEEDKLKEQQQQHQQDLNGEEQNNNNSNSNDNENDENKTKQSPKKRRGLLPSPPSNIASPPLPPRPADQIPNTPSSNPNTPTTKRGKRLLKSCGSRNVMIESVDISEFDQYVGNTAIADVEFDMMTPLTMPDNSLEINKCRVPFSVVVKSVDQIREEVFGIHISHGEEVVTVSALPFSQIQVRISLYYNGEPLPGCGMISRGVNVRRPSFSGFDDQVREHSDKTRFRSTRNLSHAYWSPTTELLSELHYCDLPRETRVIFEVYGVSNLSPEPMNLGGVALPLVNFEGRVLSGSHTLRLWPNTVDFKKVNPVQNIADPNPMTVTVKLPTFQEPVVFPLEFTAKNEQSQASEMMIDHGGWMNKLGPRKRFGRWTKRWFHLSEQHSVLAYYKSNLDSRPIAVIRLQPYMTVELASHMNKSYEHIVGSTRKQKSTHCFCLNTPRRKFFIYTESQQETRQWMDQIAMVMLNSPLLPDTDEVVLKGKLLLNISHIIGQLKAHSGSAHEADWVRELANDFSDSEDATSESKKIGMKNQAIDIQKPDLTALTGDKNPIIITDSREDTVMDATENAKSMSSDEIRKYVKFESCLNDPALLGGFTAYLKNLKALENLYFCLEAERFYHQFSMLTTVAESKVGEEFQESIDEINNLMLIDAKRLYETYIEAPKGDSGDFIIGAGMLTISRLRKFIFPSDARNRTTQSSRQRFGSSAKLEVGLTNLPATLFQRAQIQARESVDPQFRAYLDHLDKNEQDVPLTWNQTRCIVLGGEMGQKGMTELKKSFPKRPAEFLAQCLLDMSFNLNAVKMFLKQNKSGMTPMGSVYKAREMNYESRQKEGSTVFLEEFWFSFLDEYYYPGCDKGLPLSELETIKKAMFHSQGEEEEETFDEENEVEGDPWDRLRESTNNPTSQQSEAAQAVQRGYIHDMLTYKNILGLDNLRNNSNTNLTPTPNQSNSSSPRKRSQSSYKNTSKVTSPRARKFTTTEQKSMKKTDVMSELKRIFTLCPLDPLNSMQKASLWKHRKMCLKYPEALNKVLRGATWYNPGQVLEVHKMLDEWADLKNGTDSLDLLDFKYSDVFVRKFAVKNLNRLDNKALKFVLPQLVQSLKYELHHDSPLARFLLARAWLCPYDIGMSLFWSFKVEAGLSPVVAERYNALLGCYLEHCGSAQRELLAVQTQLWSEDGVFAKTCQIIKKLVKKLPKEKRKDAFAKTYRKAAICLPKEFILPINPQWRVKKLTIEKCRVMSSAKRPLWLVFENADPNGKPIPVMFKAGDDIRQDCVVLQLIEVMGRLWAENGMDLRLSPYAILSTWHDGGLLEIVQNSDTTAAIQTSQGGTFGAWVDSSFSKWIRSHNSTDEKFAKAVDNFIRSSAGYIVATFAMGIGDRHNDNIMVKKTGHYFHIDFGHFLGNFKYQFGIKRERTAFVFTPEMAHVMGGKGSEKYDEFKELCCRALNILRKNGTMLVNMFLLMVSAGMPELANAEDIRYFQDKLMFEKNDEEVAQYFDKELDQALSNKFKRFDNTIHILKHK